MAQTLRIQGRLVTACVGVSILLWTCRVDAGLAATWDYCECVWQPWLAWSDCTEECYGLRVRERQVQLTQNPGCDTFNDCATDDMGQEDSICNGACFHGGTYMQRLDRCSCIEGRNGRCCGNIVTCGDPGELANGKKSGTNFNYGGAVTYRCNVHYNMTGGNSRRVCQGDGIWSGTEPTCVFVNTCGSSPCKNGAQCIDGLNQYTCVCQPGWSGKNCDMDVQPPVVSGCSEDLTVYTADSVATVGWVVPEFHDPRGNTVRVVGNYHEESQYDFPWGDFNISYVATKESNGLKSECIFTVRIRPYPCDELNIPVNGARVCNGWGTDYGQYCLVFCSNNFTIPRDYDFKQWYVCGASGVWISPPYMPNCTIPSYSFVETADDTTLETIEDRKFDSCQTRRVNMASKYIQEIRASSFVEFCTNFDSCNKEHVKVDCF